MVSRVRKYTKKSIVQLRMHVMLASIDARLGHVFLRSDIFALFQVNVKLRQDLFLKKANSNKTLFCIVSVFRNPQHSRQNPASTPNPLLVITTLLSTLLFKTTPHIFFRSISSNPSVIHPQPAPPCNP